MPTPIIDTFFALLRYSLDNCHCEERSDVAIEAAPSAVIPGTSNVIPGTDPGSPLTEPLSPEEWKAIFSLSKKQSLLGVIYSGVKRLPAELQPPADLMQQWMQLARRIMAANNLMNATAARLTQIFGERGRKTVILKGQANALLYPDPYLRQAGDIDILVEGGRKSVIKLLDEMGVLEEMDFLEVSSLHAHVKSDKFSGVIPPGVSIEVHFTPGYNNSPFSSRAMCRFLEQENSKPGAVKLSGQGFNVPPLTFALVMQLSHLQRHYYDEGIGLRQLVDYYLLLCHSTDADRDLVRKNLRKTGLYHVGGAVMWVMGRVFGLPESKMLCESDDFRGMLLLEHVLEGGNFGKYSWDKELSTANYWFFKRIRVFGRLRFDVLETLWGEYRYVVNTIRSIPYRIKIRRISLRNK